MSTLYVKNQAQKIIFVHEMQGQLSDGFWENSRPWGHYKPWCRTEVSISDNVGRDFYAEKSNYNFANKGLLDVVGDRILMKVKAALLGFSEEAISVMPNSLQDYEWHLEQSEMSSNEYWTRKIEKMNSLGINASTVKAIEDFNGYTLKDLKKDCNELRKACQTHL